MMIRALLRKQLRELGAAFLRSSKTGKARSRASAVGYALLFAVLVVVLMLCFAGMALPLASVLLPAGLDWLYFASMGLTALLVSVLASAFTSYSGLFQSRDNELLLSLPIPPAVIFGVRVSTVYLACLIYLLMAWVPAVVCYGLLAAHPLAGVLCSIPMALVLAGAACILAVLLGWAVALANDRARHKSLVTVVCSLVFFALYYAGFLRVQEMLERHYEGSNFVHVQPLKTPAEMTATKLSCNDLRDTNQMEIFVFGDAEQILLCSRLDNLGKGAAGQAVQCANIVFGLPETCGLEEIANPV